MDGASDSKPVLGLSHQPTTIRQPEPKPAKLRRFMSISSKLRDSRLSSKHHHMSTSSGTTPPLQVLAPHTAEVESRSKTHAIRSISSLFLSRSPSGAPEPVESGDSARPVQDQLRDAESSSLPCPPPAGTKADGISPKGQELPSHTGSLYQFAQVESRKDSAVKSFYDMPTAASRAAALTSHPVGEEDLDSDDEMQKPGLVWDLEKTASETGYA